METASFAGVTGDIADLLDTQQKRVAVAIVADRSHFLDMAGGRAFVPEFFSRSTPVPRFPGRQGFLQGFPIHPRHHQDGSIEIILRDRGD